MEKPKYHQILYNKLYPPNSLEDDLFKRIDEVENQIDDQFRDVIEIPDDLKKIIDGYKFVARSKQIKEFLTQKRATLDRLEKLFQKEFSYRREDHFSNMKWLVEGKIGENIKSVGAFLPVVNFLWMLTRDNNKGERQKNMAEEADRWSGHDRYLDENGNKCFYSSFFTNKKFWDDIVATTGNSKTSIRAVMAFLIEKEIIKPLCKRKTDKGYLYADGYFTSDYKGGKSRKVAFLKKEPKIMKSLCQLREFVRNYERRGKNQR